MSELTDQIKVVVEARAKADRMADKKRASYQTWEAQNRVGLDELIVAEQEVKDNEATLRELTLKAYAETGNKAPATGVGIREVIKLQYDSEEAFGWAMKHTIALKLDTRAFEKIVKASPLGFVEVTTEPQATISANLAVVES